MKREPYHIDRHLFFDYLDEHYLTRPLTKGQRDGLDHILNAWEKRFSRRQERILARALATLDAETGGEFQQLEPPGEGRRRERRSPLPNKRIAEAFDSAAATTANDVRAEQYYSALVGIRPVTVAEVLTEELRHVRQVGESGSGDLTDVFKLLHREKTAALCFSGGGIRSATFGLGIVQALARRGLLEKFDYLSTVSGGGYLGSWLSAWVYREQLLPQVAQVAGKIEEGPRDPVVREPLAAERRRIGIRKVQDKINCVPFTDSSPNPEPKQLQHLREYSNYMSPRVGMMSADTWTLVAIYLRNLFLNLTIFLPLIAAVLLLPRFLFTAIITPSDAVTVLTASILLGSFAIAYVISRLPSRNKIPGSPERSGAQDGHPELDELVEAESDGEICQDPAEQQPVSDLKSADLQILILGVFPLVISAFCAVCVWAWNYRSGGQLLTTLNVLSFDLVSMSTLTVVYFVAVSVVAYIVGLLFYVLICIAEGIWHRGAAFLADLPTNALDDLRRRGVLLLYALASTAIGGALLWLVSEKVLYSVLGSDLLHRFFGGYGWQFYACIALPAFLLIVLIAATIFVGFSSGRATDEDREWLARYGGWVLIICVHWMVTNALVLIGPSVLEWTYRFDPSWPNWRESLPAAVSIIVTIASAVISVIGGFSEKSLVRDEPVKSRTSKILAYAPRVAAVVFLTFVLIGIAYLTSRLLHLVYTGPEGVRLIPEFAHGAVLNQMPVVYIFATAIVAAVIGVGMAFFVNVNKFSLHGAYRDRLVRAYLGASNTRRRQDSFTGFDDSDNFQQHRLKDQKPFHVINATLNLIGGKNLAWQNRKAASFTMSPLHCGSWTLGYRHTNEFCRNENLGKCKSLADCNQLRTTCGLNSDGTPDCKLPGKALRLGTAMAISGAAANPNMGYYSSPVVTFLMSLFNVRLGWWLGNTGPVGSKKDLFGNGRPYFRKSSPTIAVLPLLNETMGRTDEQKRYINVTDGGHFENLALYEMVLRRCHFILLSDGAADETFKFGEIANAIQKCKVDLGVDIKFLGAMNIHARGIKEEGKELKRSRFAIAQITYPEKDEQDKPYIGWLLYTRPAYYGTTEPRDIRNYADSNPNFPHQSTGDQMYDEKQFEAYRGLGFLTMDEIIGDRKEGPAELVHLIKDELTRLAVDDPDLSEILTELFGSESSTTIPAETEY